MGVQATLEANLPCYEIAQMVLLKGRGLCLIPKGPPEDSTLRRTYDSTYSWLDTASLHLQNDGKVLLFKGNEELQGILNKDKDKGLHHDIVERVKSYDMEIWSNVKIFEYKLAPYRRTFVSSENYGKDLEVLWNSVSWQAPNSNDALRATFDGERVRLS